VWGVETAMRVGDLSAEDPELALSVASSPGKQPIASTSRNRMVSVKGRTEGLDKIYVIDKLLVDADGRIYGEKGELLLWIPQIHRPYISRSNTVWIAGKHYTQLDLSNFVHGANWATIYVHSSSE
jgi:hypothetical protein